MGEERNTVIITGAGRGIGAACALQCAADGFAVAVNYRESGRRAEALVRQILEAGGVACAIQADVGEPKAAEDLFREAERRLGRITALVNNAGTIIPQGPIVDLDPALLPELLRVNIAGFIHCIQAAIPRMSTKRGGAGGAIVNLSSAGARHGAPGSFAAYAASKGAIDTLTRGLALELAQEGIRVNAVRPGLIDTEIHAAGGVPDQVARLGGKLPMGRAGRPEEVAAAVGWLLSNKASYVTGALLDVGGGR